MASTGWTRYANRSGGTPMPHTSCLGQELRKAQSALPRSILREFLQGFAFDEGGFRFILK